MRTSLAISDVSKTAFEHGQLPDSSISNLFSRFQHEIPGTACRNGCGHQVIDGTMAEHFEDCPLETVQCPYVNCVETMYRCNLDAHVKKAVSFHLNHERLCHEEEVSVIPRTYGSLSTSPDRRLLFSHRRYRAWGSRNSASTTE